MISSTHQCSKCASNEWDYANVGLPNALVCLDCGHIYNSTETEVDTGPKYSLGPNPLDKFPTIWSK